ncbi:unnamed protein product, partial [Prorocentrum cordatum]
PGQKLSPSVAACRRWAPAPPAGRDGLLALRPQRAPDRCPRRGRRRLGGAGRRQVAAPARPGERAVRGAGARGPRLRLRVHARLAVGVRPAGNDPDGDFDGEGAGTEEEDLRRRAALRLGAVLAVPAVRRELQRGRRVAAALPRRPPGGNGGGGRATGFVRFHKLTGASAPPSLGAPAGQCGLLSARRARLRTGPPLASRGGRAGSAAHGA